MGLLQTLLGMLGKGGGGGMVGALQGLLGGGSSVGGLSGLLGKLDAEGLGDIGQSWVSKGANLPISSEQLTKLLGNEQVAAIAKKLGVSPEGAASQLSKLLPDAVDKLTPDGTVPDSADLSQRLGGLGKALGR
jgi:uncharacterized protein YidB (DUF937 family)